MARATISPGRAADLPPVCVCCGGPATRLRPQDFRLEGLKTLGVFAASVAAGGLTWSEKSVRLALPVCDAHRRRGRDSNRTFFWGILLTGLLGVGGYYGSDLDRAVGGYLVLAAIAAGVGTMLAAMHQSDDGLKVKAVGPDGVTLTGVNRRFAAALVPSGDGRPL